MDITGNTERRSIFESENRLQTFRREMARLRRGNKDIFEIIDELVFEVKNLRNRMDKAENYIQKTESSKIEEVDDGK